MKKVAILGLSCFALMLAVTASAKERVGDPYTLGTCPVSGEKLGSMGDAPVLINEDGREVRLCCAGCEKKYKANMEAMNAKIDEQLIADQKDHYPSDTCINSGADLKGAGVSFVVGNRLVKTCCDKCKAKVEADPASYLAKLDKQVEEAHKDDKAGACPVSGKAVGDEPVKVVVANRLVELCCGGCKKKVEEEPRAILDKVDGK